MIPSPISVPVAPFAGKLPMRVHALRRRLYDEARHCRRACVRFQDLSRGSASQAKNLEVDPRLRIHLNPIRAWMHDQETADVIASEDARPMLGADVVLFFAGDDVRSFAATTPERTLLHQLAEIGPCTLNAWLAHEQSIGGVGATRGELIDLIGRTTAAGLTAVG